MSPDICPADPTPWGLSWKSLLQVMHLRTRPQVAGARLKWPACEAVHPALSVAVRPGEPTFSGQSQAEQSRSPALGSSMS